MVGPNGCGKTNIVDSIRWALGEQKAAALRSESMENVIFNGTRDRKPLSMAEASVTIENTKNILPIEYTEVTITRRIFRSGESSYMLNKTKCRLRDVNELLMDAGVGPDAYSIIELKMVEAILSGKLDERRRLFEEAAGITKYKIRRKEALRKLENVQSDLIRVQDIVIEVQKNVASLQRQAAKTRRYNKLLGQVKDLELAVLRTEYLANRLKIEAAEKEIAERASKKSDIENSLAELESDLQRLKSEKGYADEKLRDAQSVEGQLKAELAGIERLIAVEAEKIFAAEKTVSRLENEIIIAEKEVENSAVDLKNVRSTREKLLARKAETGGGADELAEKKNAAARLVADLREKLDQSAERAINLQNAVENASREIMRNERRKSDLEQKIYESSENKYRLEGELEELEQNRDNLQSDLSEAKSEIADAENELADAERRKSDLQTRLEKVRNEGVEKSGKLSEKKAAREFLDGLIDYGESANYLFKSSDWSPKGGKRALVETAETDKKLRAALEASLGEAARYFVVDDSAEAKAAIDILKQKGKGKATFLALDSVEEIDAPPAIEPSESVFGWASELAETSGKIRWALRALLGKTLIVADAENARALPAGAERAVSLAGDVFDARGLVRGGSEIKSEGAAVGKISRKNKLDEEIAELESQIAELRQTAQSLIEEIKSIEPAKIAARIKSIEKKSADIERRISKREIRKERIETDLQIIEENSFAYGDEASELEEEIERAKADFAEKEEALANAKTLRTEAAEELKAAEKNLSEAANAHASEEKKIVRLDEEIKSAEREAARLEKLISRLDKEKRDKTSELKAVEKSIVQRKSEQENLNLKLAETKKRSLEAENKSDYLKGEQSRFQENIDSAIIEISRLRKDLDKRSDTLNEKKLELEEYKISNKNISEKSAEKYDVSPDAILPPDDKDFNIERAKKELALYKTKLGSIGAVNFMALDEFEAQSDRLQFYEKQVEDLTESQKTLIETIEEINAAAEKRFLETYNEILKNFKELFEKLFGKGAEAEIKLGEGAPLEADVQIVAKPPGKRPHSIETLSGGEKTMTAIALLFAIYLVKPSPFCILDEVDAPLDDSNIDRFLRLLRDFSDNTQFLVVTHNKRTMEACDTLYGVTMEEEGVSKIVSVKFS